MKKRLISMLLVLCMVFSTMPPAAFATEAGALINTSSSGVACANHPAHDETCGYKEAEAGNTPCTHTCALCKGEKTCTCDPKVEGDGEHTAKDCSLYTASKNGCICTVKCIPAPECTCELVNSGNPVHGEDCPLSNPDSAKEVINPDCPVCGAADADLTLCGGVADAVIKPVTLGATTPRASLLDLTSGSVSYLDTNGDTVGKDPTRDNITDSGEGWSWYKTAADEYSANTLVLSGATIQGTDATDNPSYAIKLPDGARITLVDGTVNTITSGTTMKYNPFTNTQSIGIYGDGGLTVDGTGSLNVTAGDAGDGSYAIMAEGIVIESGTVTAAAGEALNYGSYGIWANSITISGGAGTASSKTATGKARAYAFHKEPTLQNNIAITGDWSHKTASWAVVVNDKMWDGTSALYFDGGSGTSADPYQIRTPAQLALLADIINDYKWSNGTGGSGGVYQGNDMANRVVIEGGAPQAYLTLRQAHFKLTEDIALNDTSNWESWDSTAPANRWKPIGTSVRMGPIGNEIKCFMGTFDGNGKTVSGLYFNDQTDATWDGTAGGNKVGLFGTMLRGSTVNNVIVAESYIKGHSNVGGVVGANDGGVFNSRNSATVSGNTYIGGIVGYNSRSIQSCQNIGLISADAYGAGGITGYSNNDVSLCISPKGLVKDATGDIGRQAKPADEYYYLGHIIGHSDSSVNNVNHINNSSDSIRAGVTISPKAWICESLGGEKTFAAVVEGDSSNSVTWSLMSSDDKVSIDADTGKATVATGAIKGKCYTVKAVSTADPSKFGITSIMIGGETWDGTCALYFDGGSGTAADPYQIRTPQQLYLLSAVIGQYDFSDRRGVKDYTSSTRTVVADQPAQTNEYLSKASYKLTADIILNDDSTSNAWMPMGRNEPNGRQIPFKGSFDGDNHTVYGVSFVQPYFIGAVGLFSNTSTEAIIKNLTIGSGYLHSRQYVGGIAGFNQGTIENCVNMATVISTTSYAGGVTGANNGTLKNCHNTGGISGISVIGGIVGGNSGKVENCTNIGNLSGTEHSIGGIVGLNYYNSSTRQSGTVIKCTSPKGLVPHATGDTGAYMWPGRFVYYRGHIIGNGDDGSGSNNSSGNVANGLSISPDSWTCSTPSSKVFTATVNNGTGDQSVTWSILNGDGSISIDQDGKVTVTNCDWDGKSYTITATSTSDSNKYATASVIVSMPTPTAPAITTTSLPNGMVGTAYNQTLAATGYPAPAWSISEGSLPPGLSLNETTGAITGTPAASGTYTFTVKAANNLGEDTKSLSITVTSPITAISISPKVATVKKTKTQQFTATVTGSATNTVTWSVSGGSNSSIDSAGLLTVGGREAASTLTIKAISTLDSSKSATATVTVTAAPRTFTVTFDSDGGSAVAAVGNVEEGSAIKLPNRPTKENHRFDGWYTAKIGGKQFTSASAVMDNITVYARWTKLVTVSGIVVEEEGETPIVGATVTLLPAYGSTAVITGADGTFSFTGIPEDYFTATAAFADDSSITVNVTGDYSNVKIVRPKPTIMITGQPQDAYIIKGIAGQSAVYRVESKRTPHIPDSIACEWWWLKGNTPSGTTPDEKMVGSGNQMTFNESNGNIPDRGSYKLYALAYTNDGVLLEAYSRVASLKVVGVNTIAGVIKRENNQPVQGATVKLEPVGVWPYGSVAMTTSQNPQTTLSDGAYRFETVPDGKYRLIITLPNGGKIEYGPYDFPGPNLTEPVQPIDPGIVIPDAAAIRINSQPQDITVKNGTAVTLGVNAAATNGTALRYQWYQSTKNSNSGGTAIAGATTKDYSPATAYKGTNYYYCVVSGGSLAAITTRVAKVSVYTYGTIAGTVQTDAKQPIAGATVELIQITSTDPNPPASFTTSTNPQTTLIDGKFKFEEVPEGSYKLKITLPDGEIYEQQPINVPLVNPNFPITPPAKPTINISTQPKSLTVALNDTAQFSVSAGVSSGDTVVYQWYKNTTSSTIGGTVIHGATNSSYLAPTTTKGVSYYYCVIRAVGADAATSSVAKLTVRNTPVDNLMTIEGDVVDESGNKVEKAEVTLSPKAGTSQNPQTTKADGHYKFEDLPDGKYIITVKLPGGGVITEEIIIDDGEITPTPPNKILVPATNSITITQQPKSATVTTEMTASFTVKATATKADVGYQWYKSMTNKSSGGTKLEGKTDAALSLDKQPEGISYYYCVVSSTEAVDMTTDVATLTVRKAEGDKGDLGGSIMDDEDGTPVKDARIKLMKNGTDGIQFGSTVTTGEDGRYQFSAIPYGSYSLVAQKDTSTVTRQITIKSPSSTENLTMPSGAKITKVLIKGSDTPSAAVENLESMFTNTDNTLALQPGAMVEIKLVLEKQDNPSDRAEIDAVLGQNQHVGIYLDAELLKTINGTVSDDGTQSIQPAQALHIVLDLPTELQEKTGYQIIRSHTENGVNDLRIITPDYDGDLQTLSFEADAFSTYAVVYTQAAKYSVTVIGSQVGAISGTGLYEAGASVTIQAGSKSGYTFVGWTSTNGISLASAGNATTTFIMPAENITVTANWRSIGGSGDDEDESDNSKPSSSSSSPSSSSSSTSNGGSPGNSSYNSSSTSSGGSSSNASSIADPPKDSSQDLNKAKDDALQSLADERQKAIDALPDTLTDAQRQAAIKEIDRIYTQAVTDIQNGDSTGAVGDITDKAARNFEAAVAAAGDEKPTGASADKGKPFVLLSAALAVASVPGAVLVWRRREDEESDNGNRKRRRMLATVATAAAILVFLLTTGWYGVTLANQWTIVVAVLAAIPAFLFIKEQQGKQK